MRIDCEDCEWFVEGEDRWEMTREMVEHSRATHLPVEGQVLFPAKVRETRSSFGSGRVVFDVMDARGRWLTQLDALPREASMVPAMAQGRAGMVSVFLAYDPEVVEVVAAG